MVLIGSKKCTKCHQIKDFKDFSKASHHKHGLGSWCKTCKNKRSNQIYHSDIKHARNFRASWRKNNPGYYLQQYWPNLTPKECHQEYQKLIIKQKKLCAICSNPEKHTHAKSKQIRSLSVDHCHKTGRVRGLLCSECNRAIGAFKDDPKLIINVYDYLKGFGGWG